MEDNINKFFGDGCFYSLDFKKVLDNVMDIDDIF